MQRDDKPELTEIADGLNDDDELPTDGEQRATGANGPRISAKSQMSHSVDTQVSHSLVEHASQTATDNNDNDKAKAPNEPPC